MQEENIINVKKILSELRDHYKCRSFSGFANFIGVKESLLYSWINRNSIGNPAKIIDKCKGVNLAWLETGKGPMFKTSTPQNLLMPPPVQNFEHLDIDIRRVPLISWVQAGKWTEIVDNFQPGDAEEWIVLTRKAGPTAFALRVIGDSMIPEFQEDDIIIVNPEAEALSGKYVIAKIENDSQNGTATFKQLVIDGGHVFLKPLNGRYPIIDMTGKRFIIVGCVIQKVKEY